MFFLISNFVSGTFLNSFFQTLGNSHRNGIKLKCYFLAVFQKYFSVSICCAHETGNGKIPSCL